MLIFGVRPNSVPTPGELLTSDAYTWVRVPQCPSLMQDREGNIRGCIFQRVGKRRITQLHSQAAANATRPTEHTEHSMDRYMFQDVPQHIFAREQGQKTGGERYMSGVDRLTATPASSELPDAPVSCVNHLPSCLPCTCPAEPTAVGEYRAAYM